MMFNDKAVARKLTNSTARIFVQGDKEEHLTFWLADIIIAAIGEKKELASKVLKIAQKT